jgi:hypothetical protein
MDLEGDQSQDAVVIQVQQANRLYLANASVNGSDQYASTAINVADRAGLVLGGDLLRGVRGTVNIGNNSNEPQLLGHIGIVCGKGNGIGCSISDVPLQGISSVVIQGQTARDIDAEDSALITLTSAPVIGVPPSSTGFLTCPTKQDQRAVVLNGSASMIFDNGTVQCIAGIGFLLQATPKGVPALTLNGTTVQNTQLALQAFAGTATISSSTIKYNGTGVIQGLDATGISTIDLSGADGGPNTVACSNSIEGGQTPGVSVLNTTSRPLDASNLSWDTPAPDLFSCNAHLTLCACAIPACSVDAGVDGMDAVTVSTGAITTTGHQLSTLDCSPPAG